jgi:hypothetical protein
MKKQLIGKKISFNNGIFVITNTEFDGNVEKITQITRYLEPKIAVECEQEGESKLKLSGWENSKEFKFLRY